MFKKNFNKKALCALTALLMLCASFLPACKPQGSPIEQTTEPTGVPSISPQESIMPTESVVPTDEPTPTQPIHNGINYFAIPEAIMDMLSESDLEAYTKIVNAYFSYQTSIRIESTQPLQSLWNLVELCFPLFYADVEQDSIIVDGQTISWSYTTSGIASHDALISAFEQEVLRYLGYIDEDDSIIMKALVLYKEFTACIQYDHQTSNYLYENGKKPDTLNDHAVDSIIGRTGICWCFARGYAFLLNQIGMEAFTVCADNRTEHHEWTIFKLDDKWYYADPTWDLGGKSLSFFGFTSRARSEYDYTYENSKYFAGADYSIDGVFDISDQRFMRIYRGVYFGEYYELDREANNIVFYTKNIFGVETISAVFDLD